MIKQIEVQYKMILELLITPSGLFNDILEKYYPLTQNLPKLLKRESICLESLQIAIEFLYNNLLIQLSEVMQKFPASKGQQIEISKTLLNEIQIIVRI